MTITWTAPEFTAVWLTKVTIVLIGGALAAAGARRLGATVRHAIWAATLAGTLLVPVAMAGIPGWRLRVLPPRQAVAAAVPDEDAATPPAWPSTPQGSTIETATSSESVTPTALAPRAADPLPAWPLATWLRFVWLLGVAIGLARLAIGHLGLRRVERTGTPLDGEEWSAVLHEECARAGVDRPVALYASAAVSTPVTWGTSRPVIVLPDTVLDWTPEHRRVALRHELAHVARRDAATQLWTGVACAVYWFHPLVWLAARRLRGECERACDERVISLGTSPTEYPAQLLEIARSARALGARGSVSVAMARPSQLEQRLTAILAPLLGAPNAPAAHQGRSRGATVTGMFAALLVVPVAILQPVARESAQRHSLRAAAGTPAAAAQEPAPALSPLTASAQGPRLPIVSDPCDSSAMDTSAVRVETSPPGVTVLSWTDGECSRNIRVEGTFTRTADGRDIATLSPGGSVMIEERRGSSTRRLEVRADSAGALTWTWLSVHPYDQGARDWLAAMLTAFERHGGVQQLGHQQPGYRRPSQQRLSQQRLRQLVRERAVVLDSAQPRQPQPDVLLRLFERQRLAQDRSRPSRLTPAPDPGRVALLADPLRREQQLLRRNAVADSDSVASRRAQARWLHTQRLFGPARDSASATALVELLSQQRKRDSVSAVASLAERLSQQRKRDSASAAPLIELWSRRNAARSEGTREQQIQQARLQLLEAQRFLEQHRGQSDSVDAAQIRRALTRLGAAQQLLQQSTAPSDSVAP